MNTSYREFGGHFQDLRLADAGVPEQEHVNFAAHLH
jgi:hypothetical protein